MNFIPCRVEERGSGLMLSLGNGPRLAVPPDRQARYAGYADRNMLFGIRPEHITEKRVHTNATDTDFRAEVEVLEPLGMDTMVFIEINGHEVCARSVPIAAGAMGACMEFTVQMSQMHLVDSDTDLVI